jgi:tetratricopeptide (TPR) repeat protein
VRGIVDEIIVVDTGSRDGSVEIARAFGARVFHHVWEDDFARARNQSLSYAQGDWVLILDADERLTPDSAPRVRRLADTCLQDAVSFCVCNLDTDGGENSLHPSIRMFRNRHGYDYEGIVHNQLRMPAGTPVLRAPVRIDHYGYTPSLSERRRKFERTSLLLRRQLREDPDNVFAHFNLAQLTRSCREGGAWEDLILHHARRVVECVGADDPHQRHLLLMAWHLIASAHLARAEWSEAKEACLRALALRPDYVDALFTLGRVLVHERRLPAARDAFLAYLCACTAYSQERETEDIIVLHMSRTHEA